LAGLRTRSDVRPTAAPALPNQFRKPYGPGWVLVGDAGYVKDATHKGDCV
jgi:hypothetical protein